MLRPLVGLKGSISGVLDLQGKVENLGHFAAEPGDLRAEGDPILVLNNDFTGNDKRAFRFGAGDSSVSSSSVKA